MGGREGNQSFGMQNIVMNMYQFAGILLTVIMLMVGLNKEFKNFLQLNQFEPFHLEINSFITEIVMLLDYIAREKNYWYIDTCMCYYNIVRYRNI